MNQMEIATQFRKLLSTYKVPLLLFLLADFTEITEFASARNTLMYLFHFPMLCPGKNSKVMKKYEEIFLNFEIISKVGIFFEKISIFYVLIFWDLELSFSFDFNEIKSKPNLNK